MTIVVDFLLAGFTDNSGNPLAGGKVYTYEAGTTTPKAVYTDQLAATPEANPVILDSNGRKQVYATGSYKFVVKTSADVTLYTFDNLNFGSSSSITFLGTTSGASNTYVATPTPALSAYTNGDLFSFQAHQINTGAATLNISGLGAKNVTSISGQLVTGFTYIVRYKSSTDSFSIVNVDPGYAATESDLSALNTAGIPIVVRQSITLTGNLTLTAPLKIEKGGMIVTGSNILTINGPFEAGVYTCFNTALDKVVFGRSVASVYPQWFGAIGDDSTDCQAAINIALASVKTYGGEVFFPAGTYRISTKLTGYSKVSLRGVGDASIIKSAMSLAAGVSMLHLVGTLTGGGTTTLTSTPAIGSRVLAVASTTGFTADEYFYLTQSTNWAQLHRVKSVDSGTQLTLHEPISFDWASGNTLQRGVWVSDVTVSFLKFIGTSVSSEATSDRYEDHAVNCQMAHHILVTNCSFQTIGSRAIIFIDLCGECIASNNRVVKTYDRGIEAHQRTSGCCIIGNVVEGGLIGCVAHGIGTILSGNTCKGQYGIDAGPTTRGSGIAAGDLYYGAIVGNTCLGAQREGMAIGSDVYQTIISGNLIAKSKRDGMTVNGSYISILNNFFADNGDTLEDAAIQFSAVCTSIVIAGNSFKGISSPTTRAIGSASLAQNSIIIGDNFYSGYPGSFTNLNASTTFVGATKGDGSPMKKVMVGTATWDPGNLTAGSETHTDVTVSGVVLGDVAVAGFSTQIPTPDIVIWATVLSANTVRVGLTNVHASSAYDLASGTLTVHAWRS